MSAYWSRPRLKQMARTALAHSYWRSVVAGIAVLLTTGGITIRYNLEKNALSWARDDVSLTWRSWDVFPVVALTGLFAGVFGLLLGIFLLNPLQVGAASYFRRDFYGKTEIEEIGAGFRANYSNVVHVQFMRELSIFLWSLLFVIPGIVKAYELRMVPYLLSENPNMSYEEAAGRSSQMMEGEKWNAFVLDLSFIGWVILSFFTFAAVDIFFLVPYRELTYAGLYHALIAKMQGQSPEAFL